MVYTQIFLKCWYLRSLAAYAKHSLYGGTLNTRWSYCSCSLQGKVQQFGLRVVYFYILLLCLFCALPAKSQQVEWQSWSEEVITQARVEKKPIFLRFSSPLCVVCQKMERDVFAQADVVQAIEGQVIPVRVSPEKRPDLALIYSDIGDLYGQDFYVWLTPGLEVFYSTSGFDKTSFLHAMSWVKEQWEQDPDAAFERGRALQQRFAYEGGERVDQSVIEYGFNHIQSDYLLMSAGLSPKFYDFEDIALLRYLLAYEKSSPGVGRLKMIGELIKNIHFSGQFDIIGGGIFQARDVSDPQADLSKFLYKQAQIVYLYLDYYQASGDAEFADMARKTLDFVRFHLRSKQMGFFASAHAGFEYYGLTETDISHFPYHYGADHFDMMFQRIAVLETPYTMVGRSRLLSEQAAELGESYPKFAPQFWRATNVYFLLRLHQKEMLKTHQLVLTSWHAAMASAFIYASVVLEEEKYREIGLQAVGFITQHLTHDQGRLVRYYANEKAEGEAFLEDYAMVMTALLQAYQITKDSQYLAQVKTLSAQADRLFGDEAQGGYYYTADANHRLLRPKIGRDQAFINANAAMAYALSLLAKATGETSYREKANAIFTAFAQGMKETPEDYIQLLSALMFAREQIHYLGLI